MAGSDEILAWRSLRRSVQATGKHAVFEVEPEGAGRLVLDMGRVRIGRDAHSGLRFWLDRCRIVDTTEQEPPAG